MTTPQDEQRAAEIVGLYTSNQMDLSDYQQLETAIASAIATARPQWQPIETAPKDGTWIFVTGERFMYENLPKVGFCRWETQTLENWEQIDSNTRKRREHDDSHWCYECGITATYWMPLPEPPEAK